MDIQKNLRLPRQNNGIIFRPSIENSYGRNTLECLNLLWMLQAIVSLNNQFERYLFMTPTLCPSLIVSVFMSVNYM